MTEPRSNFFSLFERLANALSANEFLICNLLGEQSDFVRLNANRVRQSGEVRQFELAFNLICDGRSVRAMTNISGMTDADTEHGLSVLASLRDQVGATPQDPYLLISREVNNSESIGGDSLRPAAEALAEIWSICDRLDLVGLYASGRIYRGFANSLGQRNWYERSSFNFDWSCFLENNQAVKSRYAGYRWDLEEFKRRIRQVSATLAHLERPARSIPPGRYRVYLAPAAVHELLSTVSWLGFGAKSHQTRQSCLRKLAKGEKKLNPAVFLTENNEAGLAPDFTRTGFIKPPLVDLIKAGKHCGMLVNSRSAKEYGFTVNADSEYPGSLEMAPGTLAEQDIPGLLNTGLYISNLWYTNYSDPNDCRITGMTRYACFRVENGQVNEPIHPMRFDESLYRMLGNHLAAIGKEPEWILSTDTYLRRSLSSMRVPGLLIDDFNFTL